MKYTSESRNLAIRSRSGEHGGVAVEEVGEEMEVEVGSLVGDIACYARYAGAFPFHEAAECVVHGDVFPSRTVSGCP